jgi:translation initiation factor 4G
VLINCGKIRFSKLFYFVGLIQGIFETLYDSNVVSEEGFESWVSADDPLEREGKAVALKMITSFLTWLKEADPESDQEEDAWPY